MAAPILIRARVAGDKVSVRILMAHEMESGQRKDAEGRAVPAWYIRHVTARLNGRPVLAVQWGPSVSRNPFLQFDLRQAKAGDRVGVTWTDNRGETRTDEATVT